MANLEEELFEVLDNHCSTLLELTAELQKNLLKIYREKRTDEDQISEDKFLESCLLALRVMMVKRMKGKKYVNPRLN